MFKGNLFFQKNDIRIITSYRCGHRTIKNLKTTDGSVLLIEFIINKDTIDFYDIFNYTGITYFIIRNPFEHLLSAIKFNLVNYANESGKKNDTFHLLKERDKINECLNDFYEEKNHHWVKDRHKFIYESILNNENKNFKCQFILLEDLSNFLSKNFDVSKNNIDFNEKFNSKNYFNEENVLFLLKKYKFKNLRNLIDLCYLDLHYFNLLKENIIYDDYWFDLFPKKFTFPEIKLKNGE